jgi:hypothetical protein
MFNLKWYEFKDGKKCELRHHYDVFIEKNTGIGL